MNRGTRIAKESEIMKLWATSTILLIAALALPSIAAADDPDDIMVIANSSVTASKITKDELRDIFLKKRTSWSNSGTVKPINASDGSELRKEFCEAVLQMTTEEEKRYFQEEKIKQGLTEPNSFSNTQKAVFKLRGAVSYVFRSEFKEGVAKVLLVIPAG